MIIYLLLILTITSGLIQEVLTLLQKQTPKHVALMYALGSIFFLFWHEPFINLGLIWALFILSIVDFFVNGKSYGKKIKKINSYLCLVILIALIANWIIFVNS